MDNLIPSTEARILVVEDHSSTRHIIGTLFLADFGFTNVETAVDGQDGWLKLEKAFAAGTPFHLVISDWTMPRVDGLSLLARLRAHERMKDTPFILLTAHSDKKDVVNAIEAGVRYYITKPFTPEVLISKIQEALASR